MSLPPSNHKAGVSLTQDALRKLRQNRVAMFSFWTIVVVALLAFLTPVLPLQPPDQDNTPLKLTEPTYKPVWIPNFKYSPERRTELLAKLPAAYEKLAAARQSLAETKQNDPNEGELKEANRQVRQAKALIEDRIQRPYTDAGFPKLGILSRWMVRTRYAMFGEWSLNSFCGRDKLGYDLMSRIFWGARVSLIVGIVATLVSLLIGVTYGAVSGYAGGWIDNAMMRLVDVLYSVPFIFVVIFLISVLMEDSIKDTLDSYGIDRITIFYFVVGAIYWLTMARVVRGQVLSLKNEPFIEAARALGVSHTGIVFKHILPNLLSVVIVYLTLTIPRVILFEAFLSFLGLGVEPPDVSWGLIANEGIEVISPVRTYWWLILFPSAAIGITLFALNFLGDGLRDAFDPKLRDS